MKTSDFETHFAHKNRFDTRSLLTLLALLFGSLLALPSQAQSTSYPFTDCPLGDRPIAFGSVSDFNVVALNYFQSTSDTQGFIAAGGLNGGIPSGTYEGKEMVLQNFGVASSINAATFDGNSLVVDGDLIYMGGQIFAGNGVYTGTTTVSGVGTPDGTISHVGSSPINFSSVEVSLTALSNALSGRPANGTVLVEHGGIQFNYSGSSAAIIFNVSAADFSNKHTYTFNISSTATNPTVLINVDGATVTWQNAGISLNGLDRRFVLYNFHNATSLATQSLSPQGTILAPNATYTLQNGAVDGQVFVRNLDAFNKSGETHNVPFCGDTETLLPVELTSFNATADGADVLLRWTTASETNNAGFSVEMKRPAAADFTTLEFVDGHGTTESPQAYTFRLANLDPSIHTFRLKQIDYDGTFEYSPEVEVVIGMESSFSIEAPYPNPANPTAHFRFAVAREQAVRVELYDVRGRMVQHVYEGTPAAGQVQDLTINGSLLPSGLYLVRVTGAAFMESRSLTLIK